MRTILIAACLLLLEVTGAQTGTITGKINDSSGKRPLALATITIFRAKDTAIITYRLCNEQGDFRVPGLPLDVPLRLLATYSGYEGYRKEFTFTAAQPALAIGMVKMVPTSKQLDEVIVIAERPPVVVKNDTIEFNASSFKTLPNALVEDLLKKMPGMQVDADGNLFYNGRPVNRILVDGKRFFGDDTKMVTRNLPSNFIDKVQVTDDKEEIAQNNDGDMSRIGKVINLTLRKDVKKGWFGKLYGGVGTDNRFELGGLANIFRDTLQLSLVGFGNNVNRTAFSIKDITSIGGFDRSGISTMSTSSNGGIAVNGVNFGGLRGGLNTSSGGGFNLNHAPTKMLSLYVQYFYGHADNLTVSENNSLNFLSDTTVNTRSISRNTNTNVSHNTSFGFNWKPDSLSITSFRGSYYRSDFNGEAPSTLEVNNSKLGLLTNASGILFTTSANENLNLNFFYQRRARKKRTRNFSTSQNFSYRSNPSSYTTETLNQFYYPGNLILPFNQLRITKAPSTTFSAIATYSDGFAKNWVIRFSERLEYSKQEQNVFTYGRATTSNKYDSLNYSLSNSLIREQTFLTTSGTLTKVINKVSVNGTLGLQQQWIHDMFGVAGLVNSRQFNTYLLPSISMNWKRYSVSLSRSVYPPDILSLSPIPDNSNPYQISYGNPGLRPFRSTNLFATGTVANLKSAVNMNFYLSFSKIDNAVVQRVTLNNSGVRTSMPVNIDGMKSLNGNLRVSKQYKSKQKFTATIEAGGYFSLSRSIVFFNNAQSNVSAFSISPNLGLSLNWHDVVEFNPRYTPYLTKASYSNWQYFPNTEVLTQNLYTEFIVRVPKKMVWESYLTYRFNEQVAPGLPKENLYWNAAASILVMKDDRGQIKLSVYDILNRNNSYIRYTFNNTITDSRSNVLQRYVALSFIYNVRPSGAAKQKIGGRQNILMF